MRKEETDRKREREREKGRERKRERENAVVKEIERYFERGSG